MYHLWRVHLFFEPDDRNSQYSPLDILISVRTMMSSDTFFPHPPSAAYSHEACCASLSSCLRIPHSAPHWGSSLPLSFLHASAYTHRTCTLAYPLLYNIVKYSRLESLFVHCALYVVVFHSRCHSFRIRFLVPLLPSIHYPRSLVFILCLMPKLFCIPKSLLVALTLYLFQFLSDILHLPLFKCQLTGMWNGPIHKSPFPDLLVQRC